MTHQIKLSGLKFFSHHGVYEEERTNGGWFVVDISFNCNASAAIDSDELSGTVNYENIYSIVQQEMLVPSKLIEHVAGRINRRILNEVEGLSNLIVTLKKLEPPLGGPLDSVSFTIEN